MIQVPAEKIRAVTGGLSRAPFRPPRGVETPMRAFEAMKRYPRPLDVIPMEVVDK